MPRRILRYKNDLFKGFVKDVAEVIIMNENPADVTALLACKMGMAPLRRSAGEKFLIGEKY